MQIDALGEMGKSKYKAHHGVPKGTHSLTVFIDSTRDNISVEMAAGLNHHHRDDHLMSDLFYVDADAFQFGCRWR